MIRDALAVLAIGIAFLAFGCASPETKSMKQAVKPPSAALAVAPSTTPATSPALHEKFSPKTGEKKMPQQSTKPVVIIETSEGDIEVELWPDKAPITVRNFLQYVDEGFYKNTIFHRIIDGFMIQGGGMTVDMHPKPPHPPIKNEAANGLRNVTGTIAMARTSVVDSTTSQFFINVADNDFLDHKNDTPAGFGYAVFGKVIDGMDVVNKIKAYPTSRGDVPVKPVIIKDIRLAQ
jgi:cyclophilin family peptidyl-prolyl cis-trans isomerase